MLNAALERKTNKQTNNKENKKKECKQMHILAGLAIVKRLYMNIKAKYFMHH